MGSNYVKFWNTGERISPQDTDKIKAIQEAMGIKKDGYLGQHTLDRIFREYAEPESAYGGCYYDAYVVTGHPSALYAGTLDGRDLPINAISGVFNHLGVPSAALGFKHYHWFNGSAHSWANKPDTFLYLKDGFMHTKRAVYFDEQCDFFISGMGLHNWNPVLEGYCKFEYEGRTYNYGDVHRKTWHNAMGVYSDGYVVLVYFYGSSKDLRKLMMEKLMCKYAIMLDGGNTFGGIHAEHMRKRISGQNNFVGFRW